MKTIFNYTKFKVKSTYFFLPLKLTDQLDLTHFLLFQSSLSSKQSLHCLKGRWTSLLYKAWAMYYFWIGDDS
jgi:hypothetical protein